MKKKEGRWQLRDSGGCKVIQRWLCGFKEFQEFLKQRLHKQNQVTFYWMLSLMYSNKGQLLWNILSISIIDSRILLNISVAVKFESFPLNKFPDKIAVSLQHHGPQASYCHQKHKIYVKQHIPYKIWDNNQERANQDQDFIRYTVHM